MFRTAVIVLSALVFVDGKQNGAPTKACVDMTPQHGVAAQTSSPPYNIRSSATEYKANQPITVTISGTLQGLLLQARKKDGSSTTPVGTFSAPPTDTKVTQCSASGDSWTHSNPNNKTDISIMWHPPSDVGEIVFRATIAQIGTVFWLNVESSSIKSAESNSGRRESMSSCLLVFIILILTAVQL